MARKVIISASSVIETLQSAFQNSLDCSPEEVIEALADAEYPEDGSTATATERGKYKDKLTKAFFKKPIGFWKEELPSPKFESPQLKPIVMVAWNRAIGLFMGTGNTAKTGAEIRTAVLAGEPSAAKGGQPYMLRAATRFVIVLLMKQGILERRELPPEKIGGKPRKRYFLKDLFYSAMAKNEKDRSEEEIKIAARKNEIPDIEEGDLETEEEEEEGNGEE